MHATRALVLDRDKGHAIGAPVSVITEAYLRQTYGVETEMLDIRRRGGGRTRMCVPVV
ncbi:hypothetical protein [Thiocystis violascens]|uniref:hypothetical protein n=1 Tax=Thiocystis violascens TaxID=73141 RepID=UPI0002DC840A|nr:hypothetical protein [Thiocystis violascens]